MPLLCKWSKLSKFSKFVVTVAGLVIAGAAISGATFYIHQKSATIKGQDEFSEHTRQEHEKHLFTGMHEPFITKDKRSLEDFNQYFKDFSHLLPESAEKLAEKQALKTPVEIRPLQESPVQFKEPSTRTLLAVGGPPAMMTAAGAAGSVGGESKVIYLNDDRRWPIANGSAWHIEEDADAEAPTTYSPITFMQNQIARALYRRESLEEIEKTGLFPWRTLDWFSYAKHPEQWIPAFSVAIDFQRNLWKNEGLRQEQIDKISAQCKMNEKFYLALNDKVGGQLLLPGQGAIIVARNQSELDDLNAQKRNVEKEGRQFNMLSKDDIIKRFGFALEGIAFGEKVHDRVLSPRYKQILSDYLKQNGAEVINGTLVTVYTDGKNPGGIAKYRMADGQDKFIAFSDLVMSLGNQPIYNLEGKPAFDLIGATGSSGLALVYTPVDVTLPRVAVYGGTNHVALLNNEPVLVQLNGKPYKLNLIRLTAGACITPADRGKEGGFYDSTISLGLVNSVYKTLGPNNIVKPLTVYGCNRMVSKNGQTDWLQPYPGIHVQYGAGGGGLTRGPDLFTRSTRSIHSSKN